MGGGGLGADRGKRSGSIGTGTGGQRLPEVWVRGQRPLE